MSVTRTFTVTVVSTGSGNKYFIDGVQQATLNLAENGTYKFDQSDSSNSNHPLRFSTTSDGTHSGGDEYTTGVTSSPISPGNAGAYTQITVAKSAPTLYYYCTQHSGMGGQANTVDDNSYGMWAWNTDAWGDQGPVEIALSGQSATSSVGSVTVSPETIVSLTGLSSTSAVGSLSFIISPVVVPTGQSATTSVGTGSTSDAIGLTGLGMTSEVGSITPADVMGLTGQQVNSQVGNLIEQTATFVTPTGVSATSSVGSLVSEIGVPLSGVSATSAVGSLSFVFSMDLTLTGVQATTELNDDLILKYFGKITPKDSTGYTTKTPKNSTGYTTKTA